MRITKTATTVAAVAVLVTATSIGAASADAARAGAARQTPSSCTPAWKMVATPSDLAGPGSVTMTGALGSAGSVAAISRDDVWFPFGDQYVNGGRGDNFNNNATPYPDAWNGRWDGHSITTAPQIPSFSGSDLLGGNSSFDSRGDGWLLVNTARNNYAGIFNYAEHWHNGQWELTPLALDPGYSATHRLPIMSDVAALSSSDAWATGQLLDPYLGADHSAPGGAVIEHWDGWRWAIVANPLQDTDGAMLTAVHALSPRDIWAVGSQPGADGTRQPLAEHWDGTRWNAVQVAAPTSGEQLTGFTAVGASGGQVWAAGYQAGTQDNGNLLVERFDGTAWHLVDGLPTAQTTYGQRTPVYVAAPDDVWILSSPTRLVHWNGSSWSAAGTPGLAEVGLTYAYVAIGGTGPDDIWLAGGVGDNNQQDQVLHTTEAIAHYSC